MLSESDFELIKQTIHSRLSDIEVENNLKIVYACESGSRAWGFPSANSDYDVRLIYVRLMEWYLSIDEKRDVIEYPVNEQLDINGWDLKKALQRISTLLWRDLLLILNSREQFLLYWQVNVLGTN